MRPRAALSRILPSFLALVLSSTAFADGFIYVEEGVEIRRIPRPPRPPRPHFPLQVTRHRVDVEIDEQLARTRIEETFHNPNPRQLEGTYIFPLPPDAAVSGFSMKIGGKEVGGEVLEKDRAQEIYEDIVRRVRDPGLLEYVERGLFKARVFPIPAGGAVEVAIEYSEQLARSRGVSTYRYPLDTGRYSAGNYRDVLIDIRLRSRSPLRTVHCPSHDLAAISRSGDHEARLTLEAKELRADKDLVLTWNVSEDALAPVLLAHRGSGERGVFYLSVFPRPERREPVPKDVVFVIDTSGSMLGVKLEQVQRALRYCIHNLNDGDRFQIVDFSTEARRFRDGLVSATDEHREAASRYVGDLKARGGTNIEHALRLALGDLREVERLQLIVLLTDGEPTIGLTQPEEIVASVKEHNTAHRRVFVFGVGEDLNAKLLDAVARETRGVTEYIRSGADLEVPLASFYDKIDSPVLTDLRVEFPGGGIDDLYPRPLPDLFRGDQLDLFGRYEPRPDVTHRTVVLRGKFEGEERVFEYSLPFESGDHPYLARLWALRKVGYLLEQMRLSGESAEVKGEVVRLSKRYGIITPYTSYLILEEGEALSRRRPQARGGEPDAFRHAATDALGSTDLRLREVEAEEARAYSSAAGAESVEVSRELRRLSDGRGGAVVDRYVESSVNAGEVRVQRLGEYVFYLQDGRWIDSALLETTLDETANLRRIRYLSDEYFALLRDEPGIGKLLAAGQQVTFRWKGRTISIES